MSAHDRLHQIIEPRRLRLPSGGYGYGTADSWGSATFEEDILLLGARDVAVLIWEDED